VETPSGENGGGAAIGGAAEALGGAVVGDQIQRARR